MRSSPHGYRALLLRTRSRDSPAPDPLNLCESGAEKSAPAVDSAFERSGRSGWALLLSHWLVARND